MPNSKHRKKPGGKAVKHPGRGLKPSPARDFGPVVEFGRPSESSGTCHIPWERQYEDQQYQRIRNAFRDEFPKAWDQEHEAEQDALLMLDTITDDSISEIIKLNSVSMEFGSEPKEKLFAEFMKPRGDSLEMAQAALDLLVEHQLVTVEKDKVAIHPRLLSAPVAGTAAVE